ncbi:MAG TPA: TlpA disulfide reductase family protein [Acidisarcina sp.]|nr:TlpA disulfide reductase family protein [Acidisarcina sp.]
MLRPYRTWSWITISLFSIGLGFGVHAIGHAGEHPRQPLPSNASAKAEHPIAPDFSLPDLKGRPIRLSSFRGKVVILDYWATWCAPCKVETPHLIELQKKYGADGLQIIGISMDDGPEPVRTFAKQQAINYPIAMGSAKVAEAYGGVLGLPVAFLIDRQGRIQKKLAGSAAMPSLEGDVQRLLRQR